MPDSKWPLATIFAVLFSGLYLSFGFGNQLTNSAALICVFVLRIIDLKWGQIQNGRMVSILDILFFGLQLQFDLRYQLPSSLTPYSCRWVDIYRFWVISYPKWPLGSYIGFLRVSAFLALVWFWLPTPIFSLLDLVGRSLLIFSQVQLRSTNHRLLTRPLGVGILVDHWFIISSFGSAFNELSQTYREGSGTHSKNRHWSVKIFSIV